MVLVLRMDGDKYCCPTCPHKLSSRRGMTKHMFKSHGASLVNRKRPIERISDTCFRCTVCLAESSTYKRATFHDIRHAPADDRRCPRCAKEHSGPKATCDVCRAQNRRSYEALKARTRTRAPEGTEPVEAPVSTPVAPDVARSPPEPGDSPQCDAMRAEIERLRRQLAQRDLETARVRQRLQDELLLSRMRADQQELVARDEGDRLCKRIKTEQRESLARCQAVVSKVRAGLCRLLPSMPSMVGTRMQTRSPGAQRLYEMVARERAPARAPRSIFFRQWSDLRKLERRGVDVNRRMLLDVEAYELPIDDPRGIAGQAGVRARRRIARGTAYPVGAHVATPTDYYQLHAELGDVSDAERYSFDLRVQFQSTEMQLFADLRHHDANILGLVNDPRGLGRPANMKFEPVVIRGWPYLFMQATREIAPHEELLVDYGDTYWNGTVSIMRRALDEHFAKLGEHGRGWSETNPIVTK